MNYLIDRGAAAPAYMQLYGQLRADIVSGALPLGAKLPSKRTLAEELGVRIETADRALGRISGKENCYAAAVFGVNGWSVLCLDRDIDRRIAAETAERN